MTPPACPAPSEDVHTRLALVEHRLSAMERELAEIARSTSDISASLATIAAQLSSVSDHEQRLRSLERGWWKASGGAAVVAFLASWLTKAWGH